MSKLILSWLGFALITVSVAAQTQTGSIALTADGTYQIAAGMSLNAVYIIDWAGPNRDEHYQISVTNQQYDGAALEILNSYSYGGQNTLSNFRVLGDLSGDARYFVVDVANRNGGTGSMSVTAFGTTTSLSLAATPGGSTMIANNYVTLGGLSGSVGIGTTSPLTPLHINTTAGNSALLTLGVAGGGTTGIAFRPWDSGSSMTNQAELFTTDDGSYGANMHFLFKADGGSGNSLSEKMTILGNSGNVGIGTTAPGATLEVSGTAKIDGTVTVGNGGIYFPGYPTPQMMPYTGITCGDFAESVDVTGDRTKYEPGDVLVVDPDISGKFLKSAGPYSTAVTGIYSTKPGVVGRRQTTPKSDAEVPMAMVGIVPAKVSAENGPIHRGDLLVSSSTIGYAMKGTDRSRMLGAVIGKALDNLESGKGAIEVAVTLQ